MSVQTAELTPLTERILARLPGSHWLWLAAWALIPWLNAGINVLLDIEHKSAVWEQSTTLVVLNYAALSFAVIVTVCGSRRIAARCRALRAATAELLEGDVGNDAFRELRSTRAPLVGAAALAVAFGVSALVADGVLAGLLRGGTWLVVGVALSTFLWTYVSLQLGLDRIGRHHLPRDAAQRDPGLGMRPLGDLAFLGLWLLLVWLVPLVLTGLPDVVGVVAGTMVLAAGLGTFFFSLLRLHREMVDVKARELALARELYSQAYEPLRSAPTLETLERQRNLLAAGDALEQRARAIHDWPIDEATFARVITIATSVVAITIGRLILGPFGL